MMRIALCSNSLLDPTPCGTKTFLLQVIPRWLNDPKHGVQLTIVTQTQLQEDSLREILPAKNWSAKRIDLSLWPSRVKWLMGLGSISPMIGKHDIYLSGWQWPLGKLDRPFVGIVHDVAPLDENETSSIKRRMYRRLYRSSLRACCSRAAAMTCVSNYTLQRVKQICDRMPMTQVIPHGVDPQAWQATVEPTSEKYLLALGQHVMNKNFAALIAAFTRHVMQKHPELRMKIAGGFNSETPALQRLIEVNHLQDRVQLLGFVSDEKLHGLMRNAAAFIFPSLIEGFGLPILEAFAAGTAVACSKTASLPEVAGDAALLFDPTNAADIGAAINRLLDDEPLRNDLIQRGKIRVERMSWDTCAAAYLDLFQRVAHE